MPKRHIPNPSDFSKPKAGEYLKKTEPSKFEKPKQRFVKKNTAAKTIKPEKEKPHRRSKRSFLAEEAIMKGLPNPFEKEPITKKHTTDTKETLEQIQQMPLNKYVAHCGVCSRRDAVELILTGKVKVNETIVKTPGYKVLENDMVYLDEKQITPQRNWVYYLLNKPKNYITTTDDPEGRKTVLDLMTAAPESRIYPVGRLDRNTTGLLLLTNDGDLAQKLAHPMNNIKKVYQVTLDKPLEKNDFEAILKGIMLEDGLAPVDDLAYTNPKDKCELGIEIHIGRNRIVRRIFEHLNYQVKGLDRVMYAGLTKKNLQRGKWRELLPKEILFLKHFKSSK
jgi:23S rRNA pseudouridine2605 synthase